MNKNCVTLRRPGRLPGRLALVLALAATVSACSPRPQGAEIHDPFEVTNRAWFETNTVIERAVLGEQPPAQTAGGLRRVVRNFGTNLSIPRSVVNNLLQFRPDRAVENTLRFAINSTVGIGGLFDPAAHIGLHGRRSDFGETLYVWGVNEGAFVVLPVLGPSTERDIAGMVVDSFLDPLAYLLPTRERRAASVARLAARAAERVEFGDLIDANVMQSADPYVQGRLLFLQARRYHLGEEFEDAFIDPYADFTD